MSVTAEALSRTGARGREVDIAVKEQLAAIDATLNRAPKQWGRNVVEYVLPNIFQFNGLDKSDAQRLVYALVIHSLEARGFETGIMLAGDTVLYIAWNSDISTEEVAAMNAVIKARILRRIEDVQLFCDQKSDAPAIPTLNYSDKNRVRTARSGVLALEGHPSLADSAAPEPDFEIPTELK